MIRAWHIEFGLATVVSGAVLLATPASETMQRAPRGWLTAAVRPLVLPTLWARVDAASRTADPAELLAAGRIATELLPGWTDGVIHFAWTCAFEVPRDHPEQSPLEALMTAVDWLDECTDERIDAGEPEDAAELLLAAATIVEHRASTDPATAARIREEYGRDASDIAHDFVARAVDVAPNDATRTRFAFTTLRLVAGAVRMGDVARGDELKALARRTLEPFAGREDIDLTLAALDRLAPLHTYLEDPAGLEALAEDPVLSDIAEALSALGR